ncbi:MAG: hypothetical protein CVU38_01710 [Chloroflexi bacterium HGW-Chloroflexi-1]|nr:MAG: hypothetical protein CVU38_01710 [Chloroflexi bacterium HGW-Chloroflexi-1]
MKAKFNAALFYDDTLRQVANDGERNYWPVYYAEILARIGLPYALVGPDELCAEALENYSVLLMPPSGENYLRPAQVEAVSRWVRLGGLLVGFGTRGLDAVFGISLAETIPQADDEFSPSSFIRLSHEQWTVPLLPRDERDCALPVLAPMQCISAVDCQELAHLYSIFGKDLRCPAVTYRTVGKGAACYWAYDLAHCVWAMHQGRPVLKDYDGDGQLKTRDGIAISPWSGELPYADVMLFTLRRILAEHHAVFLHQLPPAPDGAIPDALFHWGGDDCGWQDDFISAAQFMKDLGLPYHINIMQGPAGNTLLSRENYAKLKKLGCEVGIQFRFTFEGIDDPYAFTKEDMEFQLDTHRAAYGEMPVVTVFGRCEWTGWSEPARWLAELGLKGDNNRFSQPGIIPNPLNTLAFGFGTAYPFHYYEDWRRQNRRLEFTCQPISDYECGFRYPEDKIDFSKLHRSIDLAEFWNLALNMFRHPFYIVRTRSAPESIKEALVYMQKQGMNPLHLASDQMCLWWHARSASAIESIHIEESTVSVRTHTAYPAGCIIQLLSSEREPILVEIDGKPAVYKMREQHNVRWLYVAMPSGYASAVVRY